MTNNRKFILGRQSLSILLGIICVSGLSSCHDADEDDKAPTPVVKDKNKKEDSKKSKVKSETVVQAVKKIPDLEPALKPPPQGSDNRILNFPGLPRVVQVSPTIITGYEPLGAPGFESLKKMGVKTIVTVDGAQPDVEKAKEFGMRYIHIPFGYDGIPKQSILAIYKVAKETEGPIYFHCHHGRHRGPSAAAVALEVQSGCTGQEALKVLEICGTSKDYLAFGNP